jgi:Family of unknown function (DUF6114)
VSGPGFPDQPEPAGAGVESAEAETEAEVTAPAPAPATAPAAAAAAAGDQEPDPNPDPDRTSAESPDPTVELTAVQATQADHRSRPRRARAAFRRWRRNRPFWGGLLVTLGGAEITVTEKAPFAVVVHVGLYGLAGYLLPLILVLCGVLLLFNPQQRMFYSVLSVLLSLGTWLTSNLGGFFIGMVLGLVGGSLAFGWAPGGERPSRKERRAARKQRAARPRVATARSAGREHPAR